MREVRHVASCLTAGGGEAAVGHPGQLRSTRWVCAAPPEGQVHEVVHEDPPSPVQVEVAGGHDLPVQKQAEGALGGALELKREWGN